MTNHISNAHDKAKADNYCAASKAKDVVEESSVHSVDNNDSNESDNMLDPQDDQDSKKSFGELCKDQANKEDASEISILQQRVNRFKVWIKKKTSIQKENIAEVVNYNKNESHQGNVIKKK